MENEKKLLISAATANNLELCYAEQSSGAVAIMCHPHSLQGGSMNNKVVTTVVKTLFMQGYSTVRFNFRSVGESGGKFDNGRGEVDDLLRVIAWLKTQQTVKKILVGGFSFGAYVALRASQMNDFDQLLLIAPPARYFDFSSLHAPQKPWWLIVAGEDEIVSTPAILEWVQQQTVAPTVLNIPQASHFFHGKLLLIRDFLQQQFMAINGV